MTSSPPLPVLRQLLNEATSTRRPVGDELWQDLLATREEARYRLTKATPALLDLVERQAAAIEAVQAEMQDWAKRCPEDDWGSGDIADMVLADAGRHVLSKIENHLSGITPTTEEHTDER